MEILFPDATANIDSDLTVNVSVKASGNDVSLLVPLDLELCIDVIERRLYKSGKRKDVSLTQECKEVFFKTTGSDDTASTKTSFLFKPSGYGFVWNEGEDGEYKISDVQALAVLRYSRSKLASSSKILHSCACACA